MGVYLCKDNLVEYIIGRHKKDKGLKISPIKLIFYKEEDMKIQFKRDKTQNSNKIHLDKYYTEPSLAKELIELTFDVIGEDNITEVVEPSAGKGAFSKQIEHCRAYDIEPEAEGIIEQDYLTLDLKHKNGRLFIGNPPFGDRLNLARRFMKKHYKEGDYIAYILPISQLDNNYNFYEFDLVHSKNLGIIEMSGRNVHCCFNIYKRPKGGLNERKDAYKLPEWLVVEERRESKDPKRAREYDLTPDFRICSWGASAGRVLKDNEYYAKELGFCINKPKYKNMFGEFIKSFKYEDLIGSVKTQTPNITIWRMKQHIINNFLKPNNIK